MNTKISISPKSKVYNFWCYTENYQMQKDAKKYNEEKKLSDWKQIIVDFVDKEIEKILF